MEMNVCRPAEGSLIGADWPADMGELLSQGVVALVQLLSRRPPDGVFLISEVRDPQRPQVRAKVRWELRAEVIRRCEAAGIPADALKRSAPAHHIRVMVLASGERSAFGEIPLDTLRRGAPEPAHA